MNGWHFAASTLRDGRPLPAPGERLEHNGPVIPCISGLHFSVRAIDALQYAPGAMVARVVGPDDAVPHDSPVDKYAGAWRVAPHGYVDAAHVLHEFACWYTTQMLDREEAAGRTVDPRSRAAVAAKRAWLAGDIDDMALTAAEAAATNAARAACTPDPTQGATTRAAWAPAAAAARAAAQSATTAVQWVGLRFDSNARLEAALSALFPEVTS